MTNGNFSNIIYLNGRRLDVWSKHDLLANLLVWFIGSLLFQTLGEGFLFWCWFFWKRTVQKAPGGVRIWKWRFSRKKGKDLKYMVSVKEWRLKTVEKFFKEDAEKAEEFFRLNVFKLLELAKRYIRICSIARGFRVGLTYQDFDRPLNVVFLCHNNSGSFFVASLTKTVIVLTKKRSKAIDNSRSFFVASLTKTVIVLTKKTVKSNY